MCGLPGQFNVAPCTEATAEQKLCALLRYYLVFMGGDIALVMCAQAEFILEVVDASEELAKDTEMLLRDFEAQLQKIGGESKVAGFISDTENKTRALWKRIEEAHPTMFAYGWQRTPCSYC